jgi:hypothetical protein
MAERHGNSMSVRTANVSQAFDSTGNGVMAGQVNVWRETRNGVPAGTDWVPGARQAADAAREQEVTDQVAAARTLAEKRVRAGIRAARAALAAGRDRS